MYTYMHIYICIYTYIHSWPHRSTGTEKTALTQIQIAQMAEQSESLFVEKISKCVYISMDTHAPICMQIRDVDPSGS